MHPRRLELLLELSRLGSMREVADTLGVTTSTVSQQVSALAREVGTPLLEPDGRRVRLTPAGRRLAEHAVTILAAIEAARVDLDPGAVPVGRVRVAAFATAVRDTLLPVVRTLGESHPDVRLLIHEHEPSEALALLARDEVDLVLAYDYNLAPRVFDPADGVVPLWSTAWSLGVPARSPRMLGDALAVFERFREQDWIVNSRNTADEEVVRRVAALAGFTPTIAHRADSLTLVQHMVVAGLGSGCCRPATRPCAGCRCGHCRAPRWCCGPSPWCGAAARAGRRWPCCWTCCAPAPVFALDERRNTATRAQVESRSLNSRKVSPMASSTPSPTAGPGPVPSSLPVLFLPDLVVLPGMVVPVELDDASQAAVDAARAGSDGRLLVAPRISGSDDRYPAYGAVATIERVGRFSGGAPAAVLKAEQRGRIGSGVTGPGAALWVEVEVVAETVTDRARELAEDYKHLVVAVLQRREAWQVIDSVHQLTDPSAIADAAGYAPYLSLARKRQLLETPDVEARLEAVIGWTREHLAEVDVADKIGADVREGMEKSQREFLLRQQLAAIRKELGEGEAHEAGGSEDYRSRAAAAEVPDAVREALLREVEKLERSSDQSPETAWIRTWLDTVLELPWGVRTDDVDDLAGARQVLDADHHGLDEVKERIVEYLAVRARRAEHGLQVVGGRGSGAVVLLAGPPGVGKTSLGESVARALGRKFVRVALGGVRDEAEVRGHRRTYVGALPGRIVRAVKEAGSMNPVVLLDEVDKLGADYRGDPAAALLEVLDPAQNHTFRDHYLELDLDLSDVLFIATANVVEQIPSALLDRMELVTLDGYTEDDKVAIARDFLLPRQLERTALTGEEVEVTDAALREMAANHTREAGVRQMERLIAKALRKAATRLATEEGPIRIDERGLRDFLGRARFTPESHERTSVPGVATGLAVTGLGGDVLFIEASASDGEPGLTLTGQLGDVMKESAQIALSFVRSHADVLGVDTAVLDRRIHVHVPAGAVPKDGPSAGVTMVTALVSLATGRPVRSEVGMTGEVTLNGRVLPIGGAKQKLLAAQRNGLTEVFLPQRNEADLDDVPADVLAEVTVHLVGDVLDVVAGALERPADAGAAEQGATRGTVAA